MVEANVKIVEELIFFLEEVSQESSIRELVTERKLDFSRDRKLPLERIVGIIINLPKRSLSIEIQEFFDSIGKGMESCSKSAFSQQRTKLKPLFFKVWNQWLVDCFYDLYGSQVKRWRGYRLQAVDGSTAYLVNTACLRAYFGTQDNQHGGVAMARVMQVHDVLNDITVWGDIYPISMSEQAVIARRVSHLYEDSLTLFDRGYPSYSLMYLLLNEEQPRHFIMRCKVGFNKEVMAFAKSRKISKTVYLYPNDKAMETLGEQGYKVSKTTAIKVRMVKFKLSSGQWEILLTNLYDEGLYRIADFKYLYGLRCAIEIAYGKQKNQQQMEQFSGLRPICIEQDYAAGIFVANLQSLIEKQCSVYVSIISERRRYEYKINRNVSWAALKNRIVRLLLSQQVVSLLLELQKEFERNVEPVRPARQFERRKKVNRLNGKYQTFTNYKRAI